MVYVKYIFFVFTAYNIYCQQCYICIHTVCLHMFSIVHLGVSRIPSKIWGGPPRKNREKDDFLVDLRIPYFQTQFCFPWPYGTSSCPPFDVDLLLILDIHCPPISDVFHVYAKEY